MGWNLIYKFTTSVRPSDKAFCCLTRQFYGRTGLCIFYGRTGLYYILALRVVVAERHMPTRSWNPGLESQMQQHSRCKNMAATTKEENSVRLSRSWNPGPESQISRSWNPSPESQMQQHRGPETQVLRAKYWGLKTQVLIAKYRGPKTQVLRAKCSNTRHERIVSNRHDYPLMIFMNQNHDIDELIDNGWNWTHFIIWTK
jgi:hypothetical protein